ncbi:1-hydroxycarotenoid 3,4-desaturase CrtD [Pararhizobium mangrovi]|uniref:Phytoene desaturase n=1 Tax=Pararhizobium mangrovi TaxID=2590452 RepID=A0A506U950_9HYPH|nr:1-hydroxycarotenoid 3,4-desaturase CrtD [Pararhizobium mangrovi]TPW29604.1 phytoene desaturase [Pararhizobium mangrovi]
MPDGTDEIVVIGAGVGGLIAALRLAAAGRSVTVVEKDGGPGGKMATVELAGMTVDTGPTVFTMKPLFEAIFAEAGLSFTDYVTAVSAETLARHRWPDGSTLDLFRDPERSAEAIGDFAGAKAAKEYRGFVARAGEVYRLLEKPFLFAERPANPMALVMRGGFSSMPAFAGLDAYSTLADTVARHFTDPRLRQLFGRYATYCGSSPYAAPSTLVLIAHVEQAGVFLVEGGMAALASGLARACRDAGVRLRFDAPVEEIAVAKGRVEGVRLAGGEMLSADAVVCNADPAGLSGGHLGDRAARAVTAPGERSLSAVTVSLVGKCNNDWLGRHNVVFSSDYRREFDQMLNEGRLADEPTAYLCAQARGDAGGRPKGNEPGPEPFLLVLNAPANGDTVNYDGAEIEPWLEKVFERIGQTGGTPDWTSARRIATPTGYARRFPGTGGALYGPASHGPMASFRRPATTTRLPGLYLAGGSTHPGAGVPMAALSGRLAAERILSDRASTRRFRPAAMPGGMSTR